MIGEEKFLPAERDPVAISALVQCYSCPVRYYYEKDLQKAESDRYAICKQVSYHLGNPLDPGTIWEEIVTIRPSVDPVQRAFLDQCVAACRMKEWKPAAQHDLRVLSERHGIVGMVDRAFPDRGFAILKAHGALPFGIPGADRLRIAACALCLGEMTGEPVHGGSLEHIPDGVSRYHEVQPRDRRTLVAVLRKVRSIEDGDVPDRPLNAPCGRCRYRDQCENSGGRRLSDLL